MEDRTQRQRREDVAALRQALEDARAAVAILERAVGRADEADDPTARCVNAAKARECLELGASVLGTIEPPQSSVSRPLS